MGKKVWKKLSRAFHVVDSIGTPDRPGQLRKIKPRSRVDLPSVVMARGFWTAGDGGGGLFSYDSTRSAKEDDWGTRIGVGAGCYERLGSGPLNVKWFGARGGNSGDDRASIQAALDALEDAGCVHFPAGTYRIEENTRAGISNLEKGLHCLDKSRVTLSGCHATLKAGGRWSPNSALLNLSGTSSSCVRDLDLFAVTRLRHPPAAGLVLGRTASATGASNLLLNIQVSGPFPAGALYNCCAEALVAVRCRFKNLQDHPAYFDSNEDVEELTDLVIVSNTTKTFYACSFGSAASFENSDARIIELHGNQKAVRFKDCFFSFNGGQGSVFRMAEGARTSRLTIEDARVERNHRTRSSPDEPPEQTDDQRNTRLIYYAKTQPLSCLEIRGLSFAVRSGEGTPGPKLIEIDGSRLEDSTIEVADPDMHGLSDVLYAHDGSGATRNTLTVPGNDAIWLEDTSTADSNIVFVMDGGDAPFRGGGHPDNRIISSLPSVGAPSVEAQDDSAAENVEELKSDFNELLAKLRSAGVMDA